jgi:hypothetical protein
VNRLDGLRLTTAVLSIVLAASACCGCGAKKASMNGTSAGNERSEGRHKGSAGPLAALVPLKSNQGILAQRGFSIGPIAAAGRYLFWEAAGGDEDQDVVLLERDLETGANRILAHGVFPAFGIAATTHKVIYATRTDAGAQLAAADPDGGRPRVLSHSLIAPFDARGDMVAWPEGDSMRQRVVVRNLRNGRQFVALDAPRCRGSRCYRIDRVTVANEGVVFDLGSVGQGYPSLIARRRWQAAKASFTEIPNDPQPDLARSAYGALYYRLQRGWTEWNFDEARPRPLHGGRPWVLDAEGERRLVLSGKTCSTRVGLRVDGGPTTALPAPNSTPASPTRFGALCRQLTGFAWSGKRLLLSWTITPKLSIQGHTDVGVSGIITAARIP